jgi:hypothetical protein
MQIFCNYSATFLVPPAAGGGKKGRERGHLALRQRAAPSALPAEQLRQMTSEYQYYRTFSYHAIAVCANRAVDSYVSLHLF